SLVQLEEIKRHRAGLQPARGDLIALAEARRLTGLPPGALKHRIHSRGIETHPLLMRQRDGKKVRLHTAIRRSDLDAIRQEFRTDNLPEGRVTVKEAAERCGVHSTTMWSWCKNRCPYLGRRLDWVKDRSPAGRPRFLVLRADTEAIRGLKQA